MQGNFLPCGENALSQSLKLQLCSVTWQHACAQKCQAYHALLLDSITAAMQ